MADLSLRVSEDRDTASEMADWTMLYQAEMPRLVSYLMKCFGDTDIHDAADAAQSAFTELLANWGTVRSPRPWLRTVAFRQMLRQASSAECPLDVLPHEPAALAESALLELHEEEQAVLDLLRRLPLKQRHVLALMYDNFSYSEIAQIMNMDEPAVRKNSERARNSLKDLLGFSRSRSSARRAA